MSYINTKSDRKASIEKVSMKFDIPMLNTFVKYLMTSSLNKVSVSNLYTLFEKLDMDTYTYNQKIYDRILLIKYIADARINYNIRELDLIRTFIINKDGDLIDVCNEFEWKDDQLNKSECEYISKNVSERLQFIYIYEVKNRIQEKFHKMDRAEFVSFYEIVTDLRKELSQLLVKLQGSMINNGLVRRLSFADENFEEVMDFIVEKAKIPTSILQTGIRQLNAILSPGFLSGRLYVFLGLTGKFKSGTLLNIADQIRKFNPQIKPVEDGRRKTILFITMENTIDIVVVYKPL